LPLKLPAPNAEHGEMICNSDREMNNVTGNFKRQQFLSTKNMRLNILNYISKNKSYA